MLEFLSSINTRCVNASVCIISPLISGTTICGVNISGTVATASNALALCGCTPDCFLGTSATATNATCLNGQLASYYQTSSDAITTSNIGSQTVASAGNAACANGQCFCYVNQSNTPSYLWGTDSNGNNWLSSRTALTVGCATIAGCAINIGNVPAANVLFGCNTSGSNTASVEFNALELPMYKSGMWEINGAAWTPTTDWYWGLTAAHTTNSPTYNYSMQLIGRGTGTDAGNKFYLRTISSGTPGTWRKIYTDGDAIMTATCPVMICKATVQGGVSASGPTLGSPVGTFLIGSANCLYGLAVGVSPNGDTWFQSQRFDAGVEKYALSLQPSGGNVALGGTYSTIAGIPANSNIELVTQGSGLIVKDEISGTRWQIHSHSDRIRTYNGSTELVYLTTGDAVNNATCAGGLTVHAGRNNEANKIVRTDGSGYIQAGYINSSNGDEGNASNPARVWGTNGSDSYLRTYVTGNLSVNYANSAGSTGTLYGQGSIQRTAGGTSYQSMVQVRETLGYGGNTSQDYAPSLGFHWGSVVASSIQIEPSGRITIRNNPGSAYENFAAGVGTATDWIATSDCRLKKGIVPIENALLKILALSGVCYQRHDDCTNGIHMGFIAQEVEKIIPELVSREKASDIDAQYGITDEKLGLKYEKLTAILVEAIKEQQKQINELQQEVNNLKK